MTEEVLAEEENQSCKNMLEIGFMKTWEEGIRMLTFSELAVHLAAKNVEHVGGLGQISDLHVAVLVLAVKLVG